MIRFVSALVILATSCALADDLDEFKVKRQEVFEFTEKPLISRDGDTVTIRFASKGFCDATVAIEDTSSLVAGYPRIVRHLASGVLGPKAPAPFQKDSLKQTLVWDGKDDRGDYIDNKDVLAVRVSLGLKPSFEKNLFWEPKRRHGRNAPRMQVAQEGVYVYDGGSGRDFVNLYGHDGQYVKAIYPFPADKLDHVKGLNWQTWPDGLTRPVKPTYLQQTFLTCGNFFGCKYPAKYAIDAEQADGDCNMGMAGNASSILAVGGGRLALGKTYLCRLATDGTSGGMDMEGPAIALSTIGRTRTSNNAGRKISIAPRSAALSPDGNTLYLASYICFQRLTADGLGDRQLNDEFHGVLKMKVDGDDPPSLFAGSMEEGKAGSDNKSLNTPASVAVDKAGRVYVADYGNNRVQIFSPDGTFLKSLSVNRPAVVSIAGRSQEIYVCSAFVHSLVAWQKGATNWANPVKVDCRLTVFSPFDNAGNKLSCKLPEGIPDRAAYWYRGDSVPLSAAVDDYTSPPTLWIAKDAVESDRSNVELHTLEEGQLKLKRSFAADVVKSVKRDEPGPRPRPVVNPRTGKVYVMEADTALGGCKTVIELDPEGGTVNIVPLPFDCEDMCFDTRGMAYLRSFSKLVRYDPATWREIPWDYGEQHKDISVSDQSDRKATNATGALSLPANGIWHHGGMYISVKDHLVAGCGLNVGPQVDRKGKNVVQAMEGKPYSPRMFPGRNNDGRGGAPLIHIWDRHGQLLREDAVPGLAGTTLGLGLDRDDNVYFLASGTRMIDGKPYMNNMLPVTLMKAVPGKARLVSRSPKVAFPLAEADYPKRPADLGGSQGPTWAEGVEWMYGGVGWDGKNANFAPACGCWNAKMAFDYFARSFAPELQRYSVSVLDSNGNLILQIGRYGNCDSAGPKSLVPLGGDEVGMVHGAYLGTMSDRRLFVADIANDRVFSVKLGYHASETIPLKGDR